MQSARVSNIDGIRGWAALCVLAFHLVWETYGAVKPELRSPVLRFVLDGPLAVYVFFVLSGDALSLNYTRPDGKGLAPKTILKRYFRLAGPILLSCCVAYCLMAMGLTFNREAGRIVARMDWLGNFLNFSPWLLGAVKYGLFDVFFQNSNRNSYNPFMWPMHIELMGSFLVFSYSLVYSSLRYPLTFTTIIAATLFTLNSFYALFFVGIIFGALRSRFHFELVRNMKWNGPMTIAGVLLLASLDGLVESSERRTPQFMSCLAIALVYLCYASKGIDGFMKNGLSKFLGRISFPLYFMQFSIITSYTSWLIVSYHEKLGGGWSIIAFSVATSALLTISVGHLVEIIELQYISKVDYLVRGMLRSNSRTTST